LDGPSADLQQLVPTALYLDSKTVGDLLAAIRPMVLRCCRAG
jgi:hypothetical protein